MTKLRSQIVRWSRQRARRLVDNRSGVVAMEFVLVAPILFFLVFAILETAFLYLTATVMEGEAAAAARAVRTGLVQQDADPAEFFAETLCKNLDNVLNCDKVVFDIRHFDDFESMEFNEFLDEDGEADEPVFEPGLAGDVVLVRVAYKYRIITPFLAKFLAPDGSGSIILHAAAAFQNEPFQNVIF